MHAFLELACQLCSKEWQNLAMSCPVHMKSPDMIQKNTGYDCYVLGNQFSSGCLLKIAGVAKI